MKQKKIIGLFVIFVCIGILGYAGRTKLRVFSTKVLRKVAPSFVDVQATDIEFLSNKLILKGTLYQSGFSLFRKPAVVLCHGGTSIGRRLEMYVILAEKLAQKGYIVLTFDFRGFGDSDDPQRYETFSDLDFVHDISSALSALGEVKGVDMSRLYVVGHSFGAGAAVAAGVRDARVTKVVSISPGRLTKDRFFRENAPEHDFPQIRMSNDMKISPHIPKAIFYPHLQDYIADAVLDFPIHPPILLVDGTLESPQELESLRSIYEQMTEPKGSSTINDADHYFGTRRGQDGSARNFPYNEIVVHELVEVLDRWFRGDS